LYLSHSYNKDRSVDIAKKMRKYISMDVRIPYIDKIIPIIVFLASPDQIILFGSYARGENNEKSDIDLLTVDYNRYNELNNEIGYIYKTIKEEGKAIYGSL